MSWPSLETAGSASARRPEYLRRDRLKSAAGVAALHILLFYLLVNGLAVSVVHRVSDNLKLFEIVQETPPDPQEEAPPQKKVETPQPVSAPAPRNLKAVASPIIAPPPATIIPLPPPVTAAPIVAEGVQANAGASTLPGPGVDAGGSGDGSGSGAAGAGNGGGGVAISAERIKGRIKGSDYPESAYRRHASGTVFLRLTIGTDGRVAGCAVDESSGHADLDAATCALIVKRYRYRPARDSQGRPMTDTVNLAQVWETSERR